MTNRSRSNLQLVRAVLPAALTLRKTSTVTRAVTLFFFLSCVGQDKVFGVEAARIPSKKPLCSKPANHYQGLREVVEEMGARKETQGGAYLI